MNLTRLLRLSASVAAVSLLALCVSSCTVGPDYVLPAQTIPDAWKSAVVAELEEDAPPFSTWWVSLGDPKLSELIERSIDSNLSLQIAASRVAESRALLGVATGNYYPLGSVDATYSRLQQSDNGVFGPVAPEGGFSPTNQFDIGVGFNWEIDVFGRVSRGVEAASAQLSASIEDYRDVLVVLVADVASNYVAIRTTQARIQFADLNVEAQEESLRLTQDRFNAGLTSARDVAQAESNLANTRATIPALQINLESAVNRLAVLLGKPPGAVDELVLEPTPIPSGDPLVSTGPPAELLRRRPDIRRAERDLAAQTARIGVATADLYPSFSLQGFLGLQSTSGGDLFESSSLTWSLVPGLRLNLFNRGQIRSQIQVEEARTQQLFLAYEQSLLLALQEVEDTLVARELEKIRRDLLLEAVDATERTVELVHTQYLSGLTDFQTYLDAQRSLLSQQDALAVSEGQVVQNLIALNRAVGGGWEIPPADATPKEQSERIQAEFTPVGDES